MSQENVIVGREYELYIGHLYESQGKKVIYNGLANGIDDGKVDLIVVEGNNLRMIQCKRWNQYKIINTEVITEFATALARIQERKHPIVKHGFSLDGFSIKGIFITTIGLDAKAQSVANQLGIEVVANKRIDPQFKATDEMARAAFLRSQAVIEELKNRKYIPARTESSFQDRIHQDHQPAALPSPKKKKRAILCVALVAILLLAYWVLPIGGVFIAPHSGTKYHAFRFCKGLRSASTVVQVPKQVGADDREHCQLCQWLAFLEWH